MFIEGLDGFDREEDLRGKLHPLAKKLFTSGYPLEACVLILATWNTARFRMFLKTFSLENFRVVLTRTIEELELLSNASLETINLEKEGHLIATSFDQFNRIKGIEATGSSKVLHLINGNLFVMWDSYIRGEKATKDYQGVLRPGVTVKKYQKTGADYVRFLGDCRFYIPFVDRTRDRTVAKQIDEVNYYYVTVPLIKLEKTRAKNKKRRSTAAFRRRAEVR